MPVKFHRNRLTRFEDYPVQTDEKLVNDCLCFHIILVIVEAPNKAVFRYYRQRYHIIFIYVYIDIYFITISANYKFQKSLATNGYSHVLSFMLVINGVVYVIINNCTNYTSPRKKENVHFFTCYYFQEYEMA